ncbi:MAG: lipopolysaccharide heptosyltransferase I [Vicinamibacteria bacterium]
MNFLIVRLGSIGDIVHTLPALAALRQAFPEAHIDWLVESRSKEILVGNPCLDGLLEVDTLAWRRRLYSPATWGQIGERLRALRARRYDAVFDFQGLLKSGVLSRLARSPKRIGFAREHLRESGASVFTNQRLSPPEDVRHVIDRNLYLLRAVGIETSERVFPIAVPEDVRRRAEEGLASYGISDYVALNPGGGWATKRWSPERYGKLAEEIQREWNLPSLVLWGPGEEDLAERIVASSAGAARRAPAIGLKEMVPYLEGARLFVGGDTGPLHIACALGASVVGVFGPTDPARNGPFGEGDRVVWKSVPCSPCYKRRCPGFDTVCLRSMSVPEVMEAVRHRLNEKKRATVG